MGTDYLFPASRPDFASMKNAIAGGKAIAFVGAGMSRRAGFADWDALLDRLSKATAPTHRQALATEDMPWRADAARESLGRRIYEKHLREYFGGRPRDDAAVSQFASLPFRHVITTNYDRSIEVAGDGAFVPINWRLPGKAGTVLKSFQQPGHGARYLIYLHGRYDDPSSIVLGERDYRDSYVRSDETFRKLFAIFSLHPVVFFGCSLRDLDVLAIFRQVFAATDSLRHFAVLPWTDDAALLRKRFMLRYGISPIFYEPGGQDHPNLERLLFDLAGRRWKARASAERVASGTWASRREFRTERGAVDKDDPQKGRFGGKAENRGRRLTAKVTADRDGSGWFDVRIEVRPTNGRPLRGKVDLWVHHTFPKEHYYTFARNGVARSSLSAYGAFTVGATCDAGKTPLELDLSELEKAPRRFRDN